MSKLFFQEIKHFTTNPHLLEQRSCSELCPATFLGFHSEEHPESVLGRGILEVNLKTLYSILENENWIKPIKQHSAYWLISKCLPGVVISFILSPSLVSELCLALVLPQDFRIVLITEDLPTPLAPITPILASEGLYCWILQNYKNH